VHALPQVPQFALSVAVLVQLCPASPPQRVLPPGQLPAHAPLTHASVPVQVLPQAPQLLGSVFVVTHDEPQSVCPETHSVEHTLLTHAVPAAQTCPHMPQFALSEVVLVHVLVSAPIGWPMAESICCAGAALSLAPASG
jgi:hypothetical protein